uniref:SCAN box domain-containing protein n=1 Tax=Maylandia zebra TaxID=106582 RepID=A0A3P9CKV8_9CICH
ALTTAPGMLSGPAALLGFTALSHLLTSCFWREKGEVGGKGSGGWVVSNQAKKLSRLREGKTGCRRGVVGWCQGSEVITLEGNGCVLAMVVREQFVDGLPRETVRWLHCHRPVSLEATVTLVNDHLAACGKCAGEKGSLWGATVPHT